MVVPKTPIILRMVVCALAAVLLGPAVRCNTPSSDGQQQYGFPSHTTRATMPPPIAPDTRDELPTDVVYHQLIFPVLGGARWHDTYNHDRGGGYRHTAQDLAASKMTPIVAPMSGRIGFKTMTFWIYGDDGWKCLGTHLNDDTPGTKDNSADRDFMFAPNLRFGDRVVAGQFIGYVGDSGNATGPHLHLELFSPEGIRNPLKSLQGADYIKHPVVKERRGLGKPQPGEVRFDGCYRTWDKVNSTVSVILVSRQEPGHEPEAVTTPRYVSIKVRPQALDNADLAKVQAWPRDRCATFYCVYDNGHLTATRIDPPGDQ